MKTATTFLLFLSVFAHAADTAPTEAEVLAQLQIGPTWDKVEVTDKNIASLKPALRRAALSTANFKRGTAFYIGTVGGRYLMATNAHVVAKEPSDLLPENIAKLRAEPKSLCKDRSDVRFAVQGVSFVCDQLIGVWPDVELAIFSLVVSPVQQNFFADLGLEFDFSPPERSEPLALVGYGEFMNPGDPLVSLMIAAGPYCKPFSSEIRLISDPDEHSPGPYKVWSFPVGCNIAWGDSGAPLVNSDTGRVRGLIWTAKYPKTVAVKDMNYLARIPSDEIWTQLSYGVPAPKIEEIITEILKY